jgi:hypothetical protein
MHSKIIRPSIHGRKAYDNKGSSVALIKYLGHEAREANVSCTFFNQRGDGITPSMVQQAIDGNVKGLRKNEIKFYSLVLSPSADELQHLTGKPEGLKDFAREAMKNYAKGYNLAKGKKLGEQDLVWFATIHQHRHYRGNEPEVKKGKAKSGELKPGPQTHVHILVSKRDTTQKYSLNPQGSKERFSIKGWQRANEQSFDQLFAYERKMKVKTTKPAKTPNLVKIRERLQTKTHSINGMLGKQHQLNLEQVWAIGQARNFDSTFFLNVYRLETNLKQGRGVRDPVHLLTYNRDRKPDLPDLPSIGRDIKAALNGLNWEGQKSGLTEEVALPNLTGRRLRSLRHRRRPGMSMESGTTL